jgi:hypothetical protein
MSDQVITLFDRINLANCAMKRAEKVALYDDARFHGEYETVRLWSRHRVYNSSKCQFIEA